MTTRSIAQDAARAPQHLATNNPPSSTKEKENKKNDNTQRENSSDTNNDTTRDYTKNTPRDNTQREALHRYTPTKLRQTLNKQWQTKTKKTTTVLIEIATKNSGLHSEAFSPHGSDTQKTVILMWTLEVIKEVIKKDNNALAMQRMKGLLNSHQHQQEDSTSVEQQKQPPVA